MLSSGVEIRFSDIDIVEVVVTDDLLRLCLDVRWSSNGFISGGRLVILRKVTAKYSEMARDTKWRPPAVIAVKNTTCENVITSSWLFKITLHTPSWVWAAKALKA